MKSWQKIVITMPSLIGGSLLLLTGLLNGLYLEGKPLSLCADPYSVNGCTYAATQMPKSVLFEKGFWIGIEGNYWLLAVGVIGSIVLFFALKLNGVTAQNYDRVAQLSGLADLRARGVISEVEFTKMKNEIIGQDGPKTSSSPSAPHLGMIIHK